MTIVTVKFNRVGSKDFDRLCDVFRASVKKYMPDAKYEEIVLKDAPEKASGISYKMTSNTVKLKLWAEYMETAEDDVVFADCDMVMLSGAAAALAKVFDDEFDVAYTERTVNNGIPINGGIIFAKPTEGARRFFRKLLEVNNKMYYDDEVFMKYWQQRYPGMNQAAMGYMIESGDYDCVLKAYKTRVLNAVECDWGFVGEDTVFLHIKGKLRAHVLADKPPVGPLRRAMYAWYTEAGKDVSCFEFYSPYNKNHRKSRLMDAMKKRKELADAKRDVSGQVESKRA